METQRLITVSLGKIAQSRGQRGGINLHKNLLVATVLHKARTAYMMESYNYQHNLQRQRIQEQYHQISVAIPAVDSSPTTSCEMNKEEEEEAYHSSCDSDLGQCDSTPPSCEQTVTDLSVCVRNDSFVPESEVAHGFEPQLTSDKENSPPQLHDRVTIPCIVPDSLRKMSDQSNQASDSSLPRETHLTGTKTCKVLKRRRNNQNVNSTEHEHAVGKKARVDMDLSSSYYSDYSDSDDTDVECDTSDSPQISNLVNIFNSGFSGLCAVGSDSSYESDSDSSDSQCQFTSLNKLRSESTSSTSSTAFSRMMQESSLLCSTQVSRLESLPSAIILSA